MFKRYLRGALAGFLAGFFLFGGVVQPAFARVTSPSSTDNDALCAGAVGAEACIDSSGNVISTTNNDASLGTSSLRFSNVYSTLGNFSGVVTLGAALGLKADTSANIKATTATAVGQMFWDTTINKLVIASGTATSFDWVLSTGGRATGY